MGAPACRVPPNGLRRVPGRPAPRSGLCRADCARRPHPGAASTLPRDRAAGRLAAHAAPARHRGSLRAPGRRHRACACRPRRAAGDGGGVWQVARLPRSDRRAPGCRSGDARLPGLPNQGALPGPVQPLPGGARGCRTDAHRGGRLRWRHARQPAPQAARRRRRALHQPGHAARFADAASHAVGGLPDEPALPGTRRAARLQRHLRVQLPQSDAPVRPGMWPLRRSPADRRMFRDGRQPGRVGARSHRPPDGRDRGRCRPARPANLRVLEPAGGPRHRLAVAAQRQCRGARDHGAARGGRRTDHHLLQGEDDRRADPPVRDREAEPDRAAPGSQGRAVPRRVPGRGTPRHRAPPLLGRAGGRQHNPGAGAGHRRGRPRRGGARRLSGHAGVLLPAVGPRGPP